MTPDSTRSTGAADRRAAARAMRLGAVLLWVAAGMHFIAVPLLRRSIASAVAADAYALVWPPFAFSFVLNGILLVPLGVSALVAAGGIRRGEPWATILSFTIALVVLALPIVLVAVMGFRYFSAPVFLAATLVVLAAGVAMTTSSLRLLRHDAR